MAGKKAGKDSKRKTPDAENVELTGEDLDDVSGGLTLSSRTLSGGLTFTSPTLTNTTLGDFNSPTLFSGSGTIASEQCKETDDSGTMGCPG